MQIRIKRQKNNESQPYSQTIIYDGDMNITVAALIESFNKTKDLRDVDGNEVEYIAWECSCSQKMCGACAMVVNDVPVLACQTFLRDVKGDNLIIEPLRKFPVIKDLMVDRSIIHENLKKANMYLGEYKLIDKKDYPQLYSVGKCLKCGICLEVCPNYTSGYNFFGAVFANEAFLLNKQSADRKKDIRKEYGKHFAAGCSKSLTCVKYCPMQIDTLASMARMNRG